MSATTTGVVPDLTLDLRLLIALRHAQMDTVAMAEYLGMSRNSVSRWLNGRVVPDTRTLRSWALATGVDFDWLQNGESPRPMDEGSRMVRHQGLEPRTR